MPVKTIVASFCLFLFCSYGAAQDRTLKRSESFYGFHFDFHANSDDKEIGKTLTDGMIDSLLTMTHPDFIQVDCKGHPGCSSYPTKVGNQAGGYTQDILKLFREVTQRHHVALYVHYSGVWDQKAIEKHPSWGIVRPDGKRDSLKTSFYSGYLDSLMIPQLKELSSSYHVDGAWIDGDSWAAEPDYSPQALQDFRQETGIRSVPRSVNDRDYRNFLEFNRRVFHRHISKYIDAIHQYDPSFQITSNWAFSSLMPEPVTVNVDYLSGDVAGRNCVNNAAFQARCLAPQGKPWDLMSWSFGYAQPDVFFVPKTLVHLEQEAAEVMAVGGGFQSYWTQNRDGSLKSWNFDQMAQLTKFCRARQSFCQNTETVPQIALWYSVASWKKTFDRIYAGGTSSMEGVLTLLLDGQHTVDILMDHHLAEKLHRYKLLVIPEWVDLDPTLKVLVLNYVANGGSLLVAGGDAVREFQSQLGVDFLGASKESVVYIGYPSDLAGIKSVWQPVRPNEGTETIGSCYSMCDSRYPTGNPVATIARYGKGMIGGFYLNVASPYTNTQSPVYRKLINDLVNRLFPDPAVRISGSENVHTVLSRKGSKVYVHLINTGGSHSNRQVFTYNEVPPVGPITVRIQTGTKPLSLFLQPAGTPLSYTLDKGALSVTVPKLDVHSVIEINE
jgi:hypothetical protein